jgi:hypothetical protein
MGYPWNTGDELLAADLNAAFAALAGTGFLPLTGGQLIGPLFLMGDPYTALQATTKQYVDVGFVPYSGGMMTGYLTLSGDPASGLHAATKHYVDQQTAVGTPPGGPFLPLAGGTVTGPLMLNGNPGAGLQATPRQYVNLLSYSIMDSGAVGDGVTDDQPVIQAWLNTLTAGAEVILPPGKWFYIHSASLVIPAHVTVRGAYNTKDNQYAGGSFFGGGGFYIDPALQCGIIMIACTSLKHVKVYRSGLTNNPGDTAAQAAYAAWAAEGVYKQTNGAISNGSTTIPLSDTSGISVGMQVSGIASAGPNISGGWNAYLVTAVTTNTSVTINFGMNGNHSAGIWVRFGASMGIVVAANCSGVTIEDCVIIGFRTGIQIIPGQYNFSRLTGDCITNLECVNGASWAIVRECLWTPLYGTSAAQYVRPGDMVFVHDCQGPAFKACYGIGWQTGYHLENTVGVQATDSGAEVPTGLSTNTTINWYIRGGSQFIGLNCHAQGASTGFLLDGTTSYLLYNCSSSGNQATLANNVAHFLVENVLGLGQSYGAIIAPQTLGGYPNKVPIKFGSGTLNTCSLKTPYVGDMASTTTAPFIQGTLPGTFSPTFNQGIVYNGNLALSGQVINASQFWNGAILDSTHNPVTSCTLTLPPYPMDGQTFVAVFNVAVTTMTFSTSDGSAVGNYGNPVAGKQVRFFYNLAQNKWFVGS